jgi:cathepsin A (carboxypeptidase C)
MKFVAPSGYVNVTSAPDYLFYWLFSSRDANPNAPLIIWTNGGPGCTSMEGATTENGPLFLLDIKEACNGTLLGCFPHVINVHSIRAVGNGKCDYTGQFSANPYAWNAHANLLYLDQPRSVGYRSG